MLKPFENVRAAVLCSHRAPGLERLLHHPQRGKLFDVVCVVTTEPEIASRRAIEDSGTPVFVNPIRRFFDECGASLRHVETRRSYDALTVHILRQLDVSAVIMLGYLYVATDVLLDPFARSVFNIHDSDLALTRPDGERRYVGLHSTRDAILSGESETRSTMHLVTPELDGGPIVMRSEAYPVAPFATRAAALGHYDIVKAYAWSQREWMMRDCWGDMAGRTLELLAAGEDPVQAPEPDFNAAEYAPPSAIWS